MSVENVLSSVVCFCFFSGRSLGLGADDNRYQCVRESHFGGRGRHGERHFHMDFSGMRV